MTQAWDRLYTPHRMSYLKGEGNRFTLIREMTARFAEHRVHRLKKDSSSLAASTSSHC
jgi:hypothetical protein